MKFGTEVHALLETITWLDEDPPSLPRTEAGAAVATALRSPELRDIFHRQGRDIQLLREQATDAIIDDQLLSGVIDRLHLHRDDRGAIGTVEIIDYKTDGVKQADELLERYSGQMEAYRSALRIIYPDADIICRLVSIRHAVSLDF
jgi:ATP-dependent exoDNAse (exonuclease V) beta subunit